MGKWDCDGTVVDFFEAFHTTPFVAVYGTLKRGFENNELLKGCSFVGEGVTEGLYRLFECEYPCAVPDAKGGKPLMVEVYRLDHPRRLALLDFLLGFPIYYSRCPERVTLKNGKTVTAWLYFSKNPKGEPYEPRKDGDKGGEDVLIWKG